MNVPDAASPHNGDASESDSVPRPPTENSTRPSHEAAPPTSLPWADPLAFTPSFDPPPFPLEVLSGWMRAFVAALAEEKQVPIDLPALLVMGAMAAAIARKVVVSPWPGWSSEPTNLYIMCALPPGERKSQTFASVFAPVKRIEVALCQRDEPAIREAESLLRVAQKRVDHLEAKLARSEDTDGKAQLRRELKAARDEAAAVMVPATPVLWVDDDTPEMLAQELVKQNGRLLAASPEARTLENISRYSDQPNLDVFLKAHAGDDMRSGRVSRGRDSIDRPALTCAYAPQPFVVEELGESAEMRGRGFLARWFYSLPASAVGFRKVRGTEVPAAVRSEYEAAITQAWQTDYADPNDGRPHTLQFSPEAISEFEQFEAWREEQLRPGGLLATCAGWGNKLGGLCVRLCGQFHVADGLREGTAWQNATISIEVVRRAVRLCREYAVPHARAAFARMGESPAVVGAKAVLRWLSKRNAPLADFKKRDVFNACRGTFDTVDELQPALELLVRHYLIRPKLDRTDRRSPGRPPSPVYEVNPAAHNAHISHNDLPTDPPIPSADSADSVRGR